jgi:hypothetical protein
MASQVPMSTGISIYGLSSSQTSTSPAQPSKYCHIVALRTKRSNYFKYEICHSMANRDSSLPVLHSLLDLLLSFLAQLPGKSDAEAVLEYLSDLLKGQA